MASGAGSQHDASGNGPGVVEPDAVRCLNPRSERKQDVMKPIQCIVETAIYADDLERAERVLSRRARPVVPGQGGGAASSFFRSAHAMCCWCFGSGHARRRPPARARRLRDPGHFALGIAANDLDAWRDQLGRHGVAIEHEEILATRRPFPLFS